MRRSRPEGLTVTHSDLIKRKAIVAPRIVDEQDGVRDEDFGSGSTEVPEDKGSPGNVLDSDS